MFFPSILILTLEGYLEGYIGFSPIRQVEKGF